jgi:hypothetical protein
LGAGRRCGCVAQSSQWLYSTLTRQLSRRSLSFACHDACMCTKLTLQLHA